MNPHEPHKKPKPWVQWFDILFVMVLCFLTLFATIIWRGEVIAGSGLDYTFSFWAFGAMAVGLVLYLLYTVIFSDRELKDMVNHVYGNGQSPDETRDDEDTTAPPKEESQ